MTTVNNILSVLAETAPLSMQESYDNAGLLIGDPDMEVDRALITLDATEDVVDEAIAKSCTLIVSHHPLIFRPLKSLVPTTPTQKTAIKMVRNGIALISMHTNLDNSFYGVNHILAQVLGLHDIRILQPMNDNPMIGAGMIGTLENEMTEADFLAHICEKLQTPCLRHNKMRGKGVKTVAICGGSGAFLVPQAVCEGADAYVTADIKYHEFADADNIFLVDAGHFETEQFAKQLLKEIIIKKIPNFAAQISEKSQNPVSYFVK